MSAPAIELRGVTVHRRGQRVLEDVSLRLAGGDYLAVLGPNGCGKTTLLEVILGRLAPDRGEVRVFGEPPQQAHGRIGYLPQHPRFDLEFPIRVVDVVLMGRLAHRGRLERFGSRDREVAEAMLERMEVGPLALRAIGELSGGELQRVLIARALATEPELLLLDEPTSSLDEPMERSVWELLSELASELTVVVVSHDIGAISRHVRHVACLNRALFLHEASELTPALLEEIYGRPLTLLPHHQHPGEGAE